MTAAAAAARGADALLVAPTRGDTLLAWGAVVGAGVVEALGLGIAQSGPLAGRLPHLRRGRFVAVTVLVAALTWAAAEAPALTAGDSAGSAPPWPLLVAAGAGAGGGARAPPRPGGGGGPRGPPP